MVVQFLFMFPLFALLTDQARVMGYLTCSSLLFLSFQPLDGSPLADVKDFYVKYFGQKWVSIVAVAFFFVMGVTYTCISLKGCFSQSVLGTIVVVLARVITGMGNQYFLPPIVP